MRYRIVRCCRDNIQLVVRIGYYLGVGMVGNAALARLIIYHDTGLIIINVDTEADARAGVLDRLCFHKHAARDELSLFKNGSHAVEHVVFGIRLHICGDIVLKGEHTLVIEVSRSRDKILFIIVFARELEADKMRAVIEISARNYVVAHAMPARGMHVTYLLSILGRHYILTDVCHCNAASAERIKLREALPRLRGILAPVEEGLVIVYVDEVDRAVELGNQIK